MTCWQQTRGHTACLLDTLSWQDPDVQELVTVVQVEHCVRQ